MFSFPLTFLPPLFIFIRNTFHLDSRTHNILLFAFFCVCVLVCVIGCMFLSLSLKFVANIEPLKSKLQTLGHRLLHLLILKDASPKNNDGFHPP